MKKIMALLSVAVLSVLLVACGGEPKTATIYTEGNGGGAFEVTVTVDGKKKITDVKFEEYYAITYVKGLEGDAVAEFFKINEKLFAYDGTTYVLDGVKYEKWMENTENAKYYVEAAKAGKIFVADKDGKKLDVVHTEAPANNGFAKSSNGYWPENMFPGSGKGWQENIDNLIAAVKGKKLSSTDKVEAPAKEGGNWLVNGVDTSSSLSSFDGYYKAVVKAYEAAVK